MLNIPAQPFDAIAPEVELAILKQQANLHLIALCDTSPMEGANVIAVTRNPELYRAHLFVNPKMTIPEGGIIGVFNEETGGVRLDPDFVEKIVHTEIIKKPPPRKVDLSKVKPLYHEKKGKSKYTRGRTAQR
jgi:hypothetical protein